MANKSYWVYVTLRKEVQAPDEMNAKRSKSVNEAIAFAVSKGMELRERKFNAYEVGSFVPRGAKKTAKAVVVEGGEVE